MQCGYIAEWLGWNLLETLKTSWIIAELSVLVEIFKQEEEQKNYRRLTKKKHEWGKEDKKEV